MADIKVKNAEGIEIATISADSVNTTFETAMVGENVEDYMVEINNNFVKLLENFAGDSVPPKASTAGGAVQGQIWYDKANKKIYYRTGTEWLSNANRLSGKSLDGVREFTLSGLDTTGKLSKTGGTITGEINVNGAVQIQQSILPDVADSVSLGAQDNRFRNIYLKEDGIRLGDASKELTFRSHNFIYAVPSDNSDVSEFPKGAIILQQETGEAIIKKSTGTFGKDNATFRKLADDRQNSAVIGGNKFDFLGDIGLIAGGYNYSVGSYASTAIDKITISTTGSAKSFGNLSYGRSYMGSGMSSSVRGVFQGGWQQYHTPQNGKMDYVTFATPGNATYFGTIGYENYGASCVTDGTRGVIGPGYNSQSVGPSGHHQTASYVTIETPADGSKFGNIDSGYWGHATSSGTRGVFGGYSRGGWNSKLEYITIQSPGNATEFGRMTYGYGAHQAGVTDAIKGVAMGGWTAAGWSNNEYYTIATPSNSSQFGSLQTNAHDGVGVSNGVRGVLCNMWWNGRAEYITIQTLGNSAYFGEMVYNRGGRPSGVSGN